MLKNWIAKLLDMINIPPLEDDLFNGLYFNEYEYYDDSEERNFRWM